MEKKSALANIIAIVGGNGIRNADGYSRNFLVRQKFNFIKSGLNYYLFPNMSHNEKASFKLRSSEKRANRILALVKTIRNRNKQPIFLVGFSRGSIDAGNFVKIFPGAIDGVVLVSGVYRNRSIKAEDFSMDIVIGNKVTKPILIVHHLRDSCKVASFSEAKIFYEKLISPNKNILIYRDGKNSGRLCGPFNFHGFEEIESLVSEDISNWIINLGN